MKIKMINLVTDIFTGRTMLWLNFYSAGSCNNHSFLTSGPLAFPHSSYSTFSGDAVLCSDLLAGNLQDVLWTLYLWCLTSNSLAPQPQMNTTDWNLPKPNSSPRFYLSLIHSTMVHPEIQVQITYFIVSFLLTVSSSCTKSLWACILWSFYSFSFLHFYSRYTHSGPQ